MYAIITVCIKNPNLLFTQINYILSGLLNWPTYYIYYFLITINLSYFIHFTLKSFLF